VTLISENGQVQEFEVKKKQEVAVDIFNEIIKSIHA